MKNANKCTPIKLYSEHLGREVTACEEYTDLSGSTGSVEPPKRKRGRPKNSTVKNGAKSPKVAACSRDSVRWVKTKKGQRCRCNMAGKNSRYLKNSECAHLPK